MIYTPTLPRLAAVTGSAIILCLFALAPVFVTNAWPAPALALGLLIALRPGWPPEVLSGMAGLATLAALLGTQQSPILAVGSIWWMVVLLLVVGSAQRLDRKPALTAIILAAGVHAVYGPISTMGPRWSGWLGNPNVYGSLLAVCLPVAVATGHRLAAIVIAAGLFLSGSVGGIIGAGAGLAVVGFQTPAIREFLRRNWKITAVVFVGLALVITAGLILAGRGDTWYWRTLQWTLSIHQAQINPLAGTGPGSTPTLWAEMVGFSNAIPGNPRGYLIGDIYWPSYTHAHNLYLHVLGEMGVLGFVALAGVVVYVACNVRGPALAGLAALAAHGLTDATALHPVIAVLAAMLIGIGSPRERPTWGSAIVAALMVILAPVAGELLAALY